MVSDKFSLSFILPMYNEEDNIEHTVQTIRSMARELSDDYEIVIADDASTDGCANIVEKMARDDSSIKLYRLDKNTKFGGAFARAAKNASKNVIVYMDSDMPVSVEDIEASLPLIKDSDIVTGYSRVKKGDTMRRKVMSEAYNFLVQTLFRLNVRDINSGYKIIKRDVIDDLDFVSLSPFVDVELFLHAKRKNCRIHQYPLIFRSRTSGKSHIARLPVIFATFRDMIKVRIAACRRVP